MKNAIEINLEISSGYIIGLIGENGAGKTTIIKLLEYNLLISGGSDFHGKGVKPDIEMGSGKNNNLNIKTLSLVDRLHNR